MVKEIVQYPTTPSLEFGGSVRGLNSEIEALVEDLKDTIDANNLEALAAFQIGSPYAVIVLKQENGEYLELFNPRIMKQEGELYSIETTAYYPGLSAEVKRAKKIKVVYEDRAFTQQFLEVEDHLAVVLQRKIDYLFGANFSIRLEEEEKKLFDLKLQQGSDTPKDPCPKIVRKTGLCSLKGWQRKLLIIGGIIGIFVGVKYLIG